MKRLLLPLVAVSTAAIMVSIALYVPSALPAGSDFSALHNTDLALVNGVPIYDLAAVQAVAVQASGIPREKFFLARFPYPPWYALSTFYLGLMPPQAAANLWFELNLLMFLFSIWFLTDGWEGRWRLVAIPCALIFLPVLGALSVGQYDFPVLLGTSMLMYSLRREHVALTTIGTVLLTFKPHIGGLILLSVLVYLIASGTDFGRRAMRSILIAGFLLFLSGFIADAAWPVSYPTMLLNYQGQGNVASCSECASAPMLLSRWLFDGSLARAAMIAVVLFVVLAGMFFSRRIMLLGSHGYLLTAALLMTLLVSPYLYNYDFILLLVPVAVLVTGGGTVKKTVMLSCLVIPTIAIASFGRAGNFSLVLVTVMVFFLLYEIKG